MRSLTEHLLAGGSHSRLPFHPDCPVCRGERLVGSLPTHPVVPARAQAGLAAAAVAAGALGTPAIAVAQDAAPPDTPPGLDVAPGGGEEEELAEGQEGQQVGEELRLDDATADPDPAAAPDEGETSESEDAAAAEELPPPGGSSDPSAPTLPSVGPSPGANAGPNAAPVLKAPATAEPRRSERRATKVPTGERSGGRERSRGEIRSPSSFPVRIPASAAEELYPQPTTSSRATGSSGRTPDKSDRFYVVQAGDTLWSIARRLLGAEATNGQVAREVDRLWRLNADLIGTGAPDLILPGQRLRLQ